MNQRTFLEELDSANNEAEVRERLARRLYGPQHAALAQEWLRRRESSRAAEASARAEAREEEALAIARSAESTAKEALRIARAEKTAAIVAAIAAIIAAIAAVAPYVMSYF